MSSPIEDRVRDLMADRTADVIPPIGWEDRIVSAGRRRRIRKRIAAIGAAVAAVAVVLLATGTTIPQAIRGVDPVGPTENNGPAMDPDDLPVGEATGHLHATGVADAPATITFGDKTWQTMSPVEQLWPAEGGIVAMESLGVDQMVYYRGKYGGPLDNTGSASSFAVSADGKRVAWMDSEDVTATRHGYLRLAEISTGRIVRSTPVQASGPSAHGSPIILEFFGDRVVLTYESARSAYAWDPETGRIELLLGAAYSQRDDRLLDVDQRSNTALLLDGDGCLHNLAPANPRPVERWKRCGFATKTPPQVRIGPDARSFAGHEPEGDTVWVRDLSTGEVRWERDLVSNLRLSQLAWESPDHLLVRYGSVTDLHMKVGDLLRCASERPACERVPSANGKRVTRLGQ